MSTHIPMVDVNHTTLSVGDRIQTRYGSGIIVSALAADNVSGHGALVRLHTDKGTTVDLRLDLAGAILVPSPMQDKARQTSARYGV